MFYFNHSGLHWADELALTHWAVDVASRISYQRGNEKWSFLPNGPYLRVVGEFPCVHNPDKNTTVRIDVDLSEFYGQENEVHLCRSIFEAITKIETHERIECFLLDGKQVWNPHPEYDGTPVAIWHLPLDS